MKAISTGLVLLFAHLGFAQSYDDQMNKAGEMVHQKKYCAALEIFKAAFQDTAKIGTYDYYYGAISAANCNDENLSLFWLKKAQQKGLGLRSGEIDNIAMDSSFLKLHKNADWTILVSSMKQAFANEQELLKKESGEWVKTISNNRIEPKVKGKFRKCNPGFALYFSKVGDLEVPYWVYIPKEYDPAKPTKAVIYLHGGVTNTDSFGFKNPEFQKEPIFSIGNIFNVILIYPFGKKDFGWVNQEAAFQNIFSIIHKAETFYNIDRNEIFLGGMSNGGTATFWFASPKENIFKGFYALSAFPKLNFTEINFENITLEKPLYSINAKDDDIFSFTEVKKLYEEHKLIAKGWHFESIETGGHGFIYQKDGEIILKTLFEELFSGK